MGSVPHGLRVVDTAWNLLDKRSQCITLKFLMGPTGGFSYHLAVTLARYFTSWSLRFFNFKIGMIGPTFRDLNA